MFAPAASPGRRNGFDVGHLYAATDVEVWPENWPAVMLFGRVKTQWRMGGRGPVGLDYGAVYPRLDRMQLSAKEWDSMMDDITEMEGAAMDQISLNQASD